MTNARALSAELNTLLATETSSVARHVEVEAAPWCDAATFKVWKQVAHLKHDSDEHARRLTELLQSLDLPVRPGNFPQLAAFLHYMDLKSLLPELIGEKRRQIAAYDRAISHAAGDAAVVSELRALRDDNAAQLDQLRAHVQSLAGTSVA